VIQFEHPTVLLGMVVLLPLLLIAAWKSYADLTAVRTRVSLAIRAIALFLVLFALSKPVLTLDNSAESLLFVVDVSDSVSPDALDRAVTVVQNQTDHLGSGQTAGLLLFGGRPSLAVPLEKRKIEFPPELAQRLYHRRERDRIEARLRELERGDLKEPDRAEMQKLQKDKSTIEAWRKEIAADDSNLESALRLARATLPTETRRRIILLSDGNATRGDLSREMLELKKAGVSVHAVPLQRTDAAEVIAESLVAPAEVQVKAPFDLEFHINSNRATDAEVRIFRNKYLIATRQLQLKEGRNVLDVPRVTL
jgi:hypothetical protein